MKSSTSELGLRIETMYSVIVDYACERGEKYCPLAFYVIVSRYTTYIYITIFTRQLFVYSDLCLDEIKNIKNMKLRDTLSAVLSCVVFKCSGKNSWNNFWLFLIWRTHLHSHSPSVTRRFIPTYRDIHPHIPRTFTPNISGHSLPTFSPTYRRINLVNFIQREIDL